MHGGARGAGQEPLQIRTRMTEGWVGGTARNVKNSYDRDYYYVDGDDDSVYDYDSDYDEYLCHDYH